MRLGDHMSSLSAAAGPRGAGDARTDQSANLRSAATFFYGRTDKPTTVGLNPDDENPDSTYPALTWQVRMPGKAATPR